MKNKFRLDDVNIECSEGQRINGEYNFRMTERKKSERTFGSLCIADCSCDPECNCQEDCNCNDHQSCLADICWCVSKPESCNCDDYCNCERDCRNDCYDHGPSDG